MGRRFLPPPDGGPVYGTNDLWWLHGLFTLLIVIALVVGAVFVIRLLLNNRPMISRGPRSAALDELDLRYARGELDRAEYFQRRVDLLGHPAAATGPGAAPAGPPVPPAPISGGAPPKRS